MRMRRMDAELMGASCQRMELHKSSGLQTAQYTETGNGLSAMRRIHHLSRTVQRVGTQRQLYGSLVSRYRSVKPCQILFLDGAMAELLLQVLMCLLGLGQHQQP